jgi:hypothetical protein
MLPYWLLFGACAIAALLVRPDGGKRAHPMMWVMGGVIALMVGLRFEVGADWFTYLRIFERASQVSLSRALNYGDPAYQLINWWVADQGGKIWVVNLICGTLFAWGLVRFCLIQPLPWVALTVAVPYIVIVVAMGYSRQGAALGIIFAGLAHYLRHGSMPRFAAYVAFAATFHATAVAAFVLTALTSRRNRLMNFLGAIVVVLLFYNLFLGSAVERFYGVYIKTGYSSQGAAIRVLMNVSAAIVFLMAGKRLDFSDQERKIWRNFAIVSLVALVALFISPSSTAVDRLAIYLLPLQVAVFGRLPLLTRSNEASRLLPILLFAAVLAVWLNFAAHAEAWLPYTVTDIE